MKSIALIPALILAFLFVDAPKPPVLSDALKAKFWKAQTQVQTAKNTYQETAQYKMFERRNAELNAVVDELTKACGDGFQPQLDKDGDPACVALPKPEPANKPEPAKEPAKKK